MNDVKLGSDVSANPQVLNDASTYIILRQQVERTEYFIVVEFKAFGGLQDPKVVGICRCLRYLLFGTTLGLVLPVRILRRHSWASAASPMVAVRVVRLRRVSRCVLWHSVVVASHLVESIRGSKSALCCCVVESSTGAEAGDYSTIGIITKPAVRKVAKSSSESCWNAVAFR